MSYAIVSWEVSTGDAARAARITQAAELALNVFAPARLLVSSFLVDTAGQNVETIRRALDGVVRSFPQEFFFTAADQVDADVQGIYPPFAELAAAHAITGQARNPLPRRPPVAVPGIVAAPVGRRQRRGDVRIAGASGAGLQAKPRGTAARKPASRKVSARKPAARAKATRRRSKGGSR